MAKTMGPEAGPAARGREDQTEIRSRDQGKRKGPGVEWTWATFWWSRISKWEKTGGLGRGVTTTPSPGRGDPRHLLPSKAQAPGSAQHGTQNLCLGLKTTYLNIFSFTSA